MNKTIFTTRPEIIRMRSNNKLGYYVYYMNDMDASFFCEDDNTLYNYIKTLANSYEELANYSIERIKEGHEPFFIDWY